MTTIVATSDTHGFHHRIPHIPDGDVFIHCGDFCNYGTQTEAIRFLNWMAELPHAHKIIVPGNHDIFLDTNCPRYNIMVHGQHFDFLQLADELNINVLIDHTLIIDELIFYGTPWMPPFNQWAFMTKDSMRKKHFQKLLEIDPHILVTHAPLYKHLDFIPQQFINVGDKILLETTSKLTRLQHHFCGHIHEAYGSARVNEKFWSHNVSALDENYNPAAMKAPAVIEL